MFKLGFNEGVGEEASGEIVTGAPAKTSAFCHPRMITTPKLETEDVPNNYVRSMESTRQSEMGSATNKSFQTD